VGFSDRQVLGIVLGEAVVQCIGGAVLGLGIARLIIPHVRNLVAGPTSLMTMPLSLVIVGLLIALLVAVVSGAVPAWRAGRMQIVEALAVR
jgi:putative ABC transport system permease protein